MGRRRWPFRYECTHPGCKEMAHHEFATMADLKQQLKWVPKETWKCTRHTRPSELLSAENKVLVTELTNYQEPHGKFWGTTRAQTGYMSGPGFKAFAEDFPPGTKIRVTAELILPVPA